MSCKREYIVQVGFGYKLLIDPYDFIGEISVDDYVKKFFKRKQLSIEDYKILIIGDTYCVEDLSNGSFDCYICIKDFRLPFESFTEKEILELDELEKILNKIRLKFNPTPIYVNGVWIC